MISVTRRQLERLFSTHLHDTPARFYVGVRLDRARELLQQTDMGILAVGVACGFSSSSHFSRAYRARFGAARRKTARVPPAERQWPRQWRLARWRLPMRRRLQLAVCDGMPATWRCIQFK